jgi:hypothetical protein
MNDHHGPVTAGDAMGQLITALGVGRLAVFVGKKIGRSAHFVVHKIPKLPLKKRSKS